MQTADDKPLIPLDELYEGWLEYNGYVRSAMLWVNPKLEPGERWTYLEFVKYIIIKDWATQL